MGMYSDVLPVMHRFDACYSTIYSRWMRGRMAPIT